MVEKSLCFFVSGKIDPMLVLMWDKHCYKTDSSHAKLTSHSSKLLPDDVWFLHLQGWVVKRRFKLSNACNFFTCDQKHQVLACIVLVKMKGTFW